MDQQEGPWAQPGPQPAHPPPRPRVGLWVCLVAAIGGLIAALAHAFPEAVRRPQDWAEVARLALILLVVTAGVARSRLVLRPEHLRHAALWAAIIAVLALGVAYRRELAGVGQHLQLAFSDGSPVVTGDHELAIPQSEDGSYVLVGKVNGQRVRFVVDTGATDIVLSPDDARRIGADVEGLKYVLESETANGVGYGAPFVADRLEVGPIALSDVGVIVNRAPMSGSLLGMSFLRRLQSFHVEDGKLVLRWR
jgi:aspartyl protease family protein